MRIAHVLTYVSADGAFGGPTAVLSEQTQELARRGHRVEVFAGWDGRASLDLPGVDVHLYPVRRVLPAGFSGLIAPGLVRDLTARLGELDVVHIHLARDLITAPAADQVRRAHGTRLFLQPHGMVKPDSRLRGRVSDRWIRRLLRGATATFALTAVDAARLSRVEPKVALLNLPNGVSLPPIEPRVDRTRLEVLFLARLHARKRVLLFAEAARRVLLEGAEVDFVVVGPDEGDLDELTARVARWGLSDRIRYEGTVPPGTGRDRIARADLYVLPSLNEPFPMSLLEALSAGVPAVTSATSHIAERLGDAVVLFEEGSDEGINGLTSAISELVADPAVRTALGVRGRAAIESSFSIQHVGDQLTTYYGGDTHVAPSTPEPPEATPDA